MSRAIYLNPLSEKSINKAIKELRSYKLDILQNCREFVEELSNAGITVAKNNKGEFGRYIVFTRSITQSGNECTGIIYANQTGTITRQWQTKEGVKSADISPLLMAEFGSGLKAQNPMLVSGVGTGTFPGQTHATDHDGWWWQDLSGEWYHSYGITPSQPVYKAFTEMETILMSLAKKILR